MELIITNRERISAFAALKVRKTCERVWTGWTKIWMLISIIGEFFMLWNGLIPGLIFGGIIFTTIIIRTIKSINKGRRLVSSVDGMPIRLYSDQIAIGNKMYYYGAISRVKIHAGFFYIFIGNVIIPIRITPGNQEMIPYMVDYIKSHMFKFNETIRMYNPWRINIITKMKAWRYTKSVGNLIASALWKVFILSTIVTLFEIKLKDALILFIAYSIVFGVIYVAKEIFMFIKMHKYNGIGISFSDEYIEWGNKRVEYKDVKSVIFRKDYIVINMKRRSLVIFCEPENMSYVANAFELLKIKCKNSAEFNDTKLRNKQCIREICWTASVCMLLCAFYINIMLGYSNMIEKYQEEFEEKYGVQLTVLEEDNVDDYYAFERPYNRILILNTIEQIDTVLDRFPTEFWDYMKENADLRIIVSDNIEQTFEGGMQAAGLTSNRLSYIEVYINSGAYTTKDTTGHEMFHVMANVVMNKKFVMYDIEKIVDIDKWNSYNPSGFKYGTVKDKYRKAFVSEYAMTNAHEDMAETFGELVGSDWWLSSKYKNEAIKNKSLFIIEWIDENFEGIPDDAYWYKWFD